MKRRQFLKTKNLLFLGFTMILASAGALGQSVEHLLDGQSLQKRTLEDLLTRVKPGDVVVMGEQHAFSTHQSEQLQVLKKAREIGILASVGMEFFTYTDQPLVESWRSGGLSETQFLERIGWGSGFSFDFYRPQVQMPRLGLESLLALNAPRALTGKVAKKGLGSLDSAELALLPPHFQMGNDRYFERFKAAVGHLPNPEAARNYFAAQSIWDDTMAWQASEFLFAHPEQVLFIIVGEFHVQYGGGLPDRLRARGIRGVHSISLINLEGMTTDEIKAAITPAGPDGARADWLFISRP